MNKKHQIEMLEREVGNTATAMNAQECIWMQEWESSPNPFIAIKNWVKNHNKRMVYVQPWLDAKNELSKLRNRK